MPRAVAEISLKQARIDTVLSAVQALGAWPAIEPDCVEER